MRNRQQIFLISQSWSISSHVFLASNDRIAIRQSSFRALKSSIPLSPYFYHLIVCRLPPFALRKYLFLYLVHRDDLFSCFSYDFSSTEGLSISLSLTLNHMSDLSSFGSEHYSTVQLSPNHILTLLEQMPFVSLLPSDNFVGAFL